jgi:hypothetical protein
MEDPNDEARRRFLVRALAAGMFGAGAGVSSAVWAQAQQLAAIPGPLPTGRSIFRLDGSATVNGVAANLQTQISPGEEIQTGANSRLIFAVESDAFLLRSSSRMQIEGGSSIISALRMFSGALLSVFGRRNTRPLRLNTSVATIGIRGTGIYVEDNPDESYVCTCYGQTVIQSVEDPSSTENIVSKQHDAPRYVTATGASGSRIREAPFINHDDEELALIEALVGREPPFAVFGDGYGGPQLDDY